MWEPNKKMILFQIATAQKEQKVYNLSLTTLQVQVPNDPKFNHITVGGMLREVAVTHRDTVAMVDFADSGDCG